MDPWAPGVRASDVPVVNGGDPNPLDTALFETTAAPLRPNKNDIAAHLYALFPPAFVQPYPDAWIEIAYGYAATGGKPNEARHFSAFDLAAAAEFAEKKNRAGFNIYVGVALRQGETDSKANGRANGVHVLTASHSWAEFDNQGDDVRIASILKEKNFQVTMSVATGRTPHPRAHLYFRLAGSATPAELKAANTALETLLGSDDVKNADRVMRLAGTINYPPPKKVERGYVTELVTLHVKPEAPAYTVTQLTGIAGKTPNPFCRDFNNTARPGRDDSALTALLEASRKPGQWHNSMRNAIATMIGRGWSDSAIRLACAHYCRGGADDPHLDPLIDGARTKWDKPDAETVAPGSAKDYTSKEAHAPNQQSAQQPQPPFELFWHGKEYNRALRPWLVKELIPETGQGLASGQWGMAKTFVVLDLAASTMTATAFAGREISRKGGVVFVAAEGANEMPIRLEGVVEQKLRPARDKPDRPI